jgi:hypothetical protein
VQVYAPAAAEVVTSTFSSSPRTPDLEVVEVRGGSKPTAWIFGHWIILYDLVNPPSHRLHRPPAPVSDIPTTSPSLERHACRRRTRRTRRRRRWRPKGEGLGSGTVGEIWAMCDPGFLGRSERRARENRSAVQHDLGAIGEAPGQGSGGVNDQEI